MGAIQENSTDKVHCCHCDTVVPEASTCANCGAELKVTVGMEEIYALLGEFVLRTNKPFTVSLIPVAGGVLICDRTGINSSAKFFTEEPMTQCKLGITLPEHATVVVKR